MDAHKFVPLSEREYGPLGPTSSGLIGIIDRHSASNYEPYPFVVADAEGPWLYDADGNRALDFLSAYSAVLSHRNHYVVGAVSAQMVEGADLTSRAVYTAPYAEFVRLITGMLGFDRVLPKSDGGSVTDTAVGALFRHGAKRGIEKPEIILTEQYFHGRSQVFASNALFDDAQHCGLPYRMPGIVVVPDSLEAIEDAVTGSTIGIFIETHKGEGGPLFSTEEHLIGIERLARENHLFLGFDEIQTGLGRCGYMLAFQEYGIQPDFVTVGKALGGGIIPVSALLGNEKFMSIFAPGTEGSTWGGYPLACAAACASLRYIRDEGIPEKARELGDYFAEQLGQVPGITTEHRGLLMRVEIPHVPTAKYACLEMLLGKDRSPRVFMKHGHYDKEKDAAYTRIAPPPGAMTKALIDQAVEKTIAPVLIDAQRG